MNKRLAQRIKNHVRVLGFDAVVVDDFVPPESADGVYDGKRKTCAVKTDCPPGRSTQLFVVRSCYHSGKEPGSTRWFYF